LAEKIGLFGYGSITVMNTIAL